jgi:EmrB/QacA subfamily drug resistance transporter
MTGPLGNVGNGSLPGKQMMNEGKTNPWAALWALLIGFFMITVDITIVAVANPIIMNDLHTGVSSVIWISSAYLLTYSVPVLATGRIGDRFSPKRIYLVGLVVFSIASLWCGLSTSIGMLIAARTVQGLGAALIMPQTMAIITRIFPRWQRGAAIGVWGATAGVAGLIGPIAGGILVDWLGWKWIFLINVPIGFVAFLLAVPFVPSLERHEHRFDILGIALSAIGVFLLVFGMQVGGKYHWSLVIWSMIVAGLVVLVGFLSYESRTREPLVPLALFRIRNFALSNLAVSAISAALTALIVAIFFYLEVGRELSPTRAALIFAPLPLLTAFLAPVVGRLVDRMRPRDIPTAGFAADHNRSHLAGHDHGRATTDLGISPADCPDGSWERRHLDVSGGHRSTRPAPATSRRRFGYLQHDPAGRVGAGQFGGQRTDLCAHGGGGRCDAPNGGRARNRVARVRSGRL